LNPRGYRPGDSKLLLPVPTAVGVAIDHFNQEYEVVIYPGDEFTEVGKKTYPTKGMVYYDLMPLPDLREPLTAPERATNEERQWSFSYALDPALGRAFSTHVLSVGTSGVAGVVTAAIMSRISLSAASRGAY
jgi:hypothetical protein